MKTGSLDPVSNLATYTDIIEILDDETGEPWFTEADAESHPDEVTLKLRDTDSGSTVLSGSLTGGELAIVADGAIEFTFTAAQMTAICPKTYELGLLYEAEDETNQLILGRQPILRGL